MKIDLKMLWEQISSRTKTIFPKLSDMAKEIVEEPTKAVGLHTLEAREDIPSSELISQTFKELDASEAIPLRGYSALLYPNQKGDYLYRKSSSFYESLLTIVSYHPAMQCPFLALPKNAQIIEERAYTLLKFIEGSNLENLTSTNYCPKKVLISLLLLLEHLEYFGLFHCDIQAKNLMINSEDYCVLVDWDMMSAYPPTLIDYHEYEVILRLIQEVNLQKGTSKIQPFDFEIFETLDISKVRSIYQSKIREFICTEALRPELLKILEQRILAEAQELRIQSWLNETSEVSDEN